MSEYKKVILSTNYTSQRHTGSQEHLQVGNSSYERRENSQNYISPSPNIQLVSSKVINDQYDINQGASRYTASQRRILGGQGQSNARGGLDWEGDRKVVLSGETEFATLKHAKDLLLSLLGQFNGKSKVVFEGDYKQDFSQRLLLLEHELEGTMRRVLNLSQADPSGSKRSLDYTKLLNQKENALLDRDRKIMNYQERLRLAQEKVIGLQLEVQNLTALITQRNSQIQQLRRQVQTKATAIDKIRGQPNLANSQELREILRMLRLQEEGSAQNSAIKAHISQLQRELNKLKSKQSSIQELQQGVQSWIIGLPNQSGLRHKLAQGQMRLKEDQRCRVLEDKFNVAAELYRQQLEKLQRQNPSLRLSLDTQIMEVLRASTSKVNISNGVIQIEKEVKVTKEIPVQDARTKYLINSLASHVRRLNEKYPKLKGELDEKLQEFLSNEMVDILESDSLDRIVDIVRYVPQMVKVQNVYSYNSEKNRKVQFHLRVLIKALLEEMEKVKREKGVVFEIDEGVVGMIRAQIMDIVDVDDILKVYRAVPKIVQVPKVIEKVIDNIVRVPEKYNLNQLQSQAVPLQKPFMAVDEKALIVQSHQPVPLYREKPVELVSHTEKVVSHPELNERVAVEVREKTKLQPEEVVVERIVQVQKPVMVEIQKIVIQKEIETVEIIKEVVRYMETQKQVPKPIQVIVEKIVQKVIEREKIVMVPQIIQKIVEVVRYEKIPEIIPHLETRIEVVRQVIQKIVPVIHLEERIVQVPQIVEKIVTVEKIVELPPKEIEVIREVLKIVRDIEIVEVEVPKIIYETRVEIREVEKYIQVPIVVPQTRVETQIHQVPFIETIQMEKHIPIEVIKHVILTEERPVQVIKNVPFIMREQVPVLVREERIIPQEIYFEKIKEVPTTKQKIIQKIVEVPKCIQIERIVEKIVIVPRIIEKIVEVPQIIQKIVEKIVQVPIEMPAVQHFIPQNFYIEKPVEVECEKIVYLNVDRAVEIPADQILVKDLQTRTNVQIEKVIEERVVIEKHEVPVTMHVDKIVTVPVEKREVQFVDRVIFRPIEVPVPVKIEKTVPVYINTETVKVEPVTQLVEKIVERTIVQREPQVIPQIEEKVYVEQKYEFKEVPKPYIERQILEVQRFEEKIVAINTTIDQIKEIPYYIEKLVPVIQEIPKIYEYEKEPKVVFTPPSVEIVDRIVPKIISVNKYIEKIVEKLVEVPHFLRQIEVVKELHEKNIPGPQKTSTALKTVNLQVEREMIRQKEKIVETKVNFIEETLRTVTEIMERQRDPVIITQDRIIEVPHVLEKIVEKIVVMPQIVEVLKYVHQLVDNQELNVSLDVSIEAQEYKKLGEELEKGFADFLSELNKVKSLQPSAAQRIAMIEQYLAKFRRFIKYPKIHQIIKEKVVQKEKERIVRVAAPKGAAEVREDLTKVLLIEKLVAQISRIKRTHPEISLQLEEDINFIFRLNFDGKVKEVNSKLTSQLKQFQNSLDRKFSKMGGWSKDHQLMLKSFLQERFVLANIVKTANEEIKTSRKQNEELATENGRLSAMFEMIFKALLDNKQMMPSILSVLNKEKDTSLSMAYSLLIRSFDEVIGRYNSYQQEDFEPTRYLGRRFIQDLIGSSLREKEKEIELLKEKLRTSRLRDGDHAQCNTIIQNLQFQINKLTQQLSDASMQGGKNSRTLELQIDRLNRQLKDGSINKSSDFRAMENQIAKLKLTIQQGASHSECKNIQRGLEAENHSLKQQIDSLLSRLKTAQQELVLIRSESPKKTIITTSSRDEGRRSIVISHVDRESQAEEYGENYQQYMNGDVNGGGTAQHQGYRSGITEQRDLANSAATYRSGQVITSSQFVRTPNNIESARYLNDREGTQYSTSTAGVSGVKKYNYYQKRYEGST